MSEELKGEEKEGGILLVSSGALAKARVDSNRPIIVVDDSEPVAPIGKLDDPRQLAKGLLQSPVPHLTLWGNPVLEQPCQRVLDFGDDLQQLVANLKARFGTLPYGQKGFGLAAPQIGDERAVAYVRVPQNVTKTRAVLHEFVMVNPVITQRGKRIHVMEGCLSIPHFFHTIERRYSVTVMFKDEHGAVQKVNAKGLLAQVIQHECDHLQGILMVEHVHGRQALRRAEREMRRYR